MNTVQEQLCINSEKSCDQRNICNTDEERNRIYCSPGSVKLEGILAKMKKSKELLVCLKWKNTLLKRKITHIQREIILVQRSEKMKLYHKKETKKLCSRVRPGNKTQKRKQ